MNYTLNQLRIYVEVVRAKSITKAAEKLHLTQPALSIQLKNFQNQFDIPLVEIISKKLFVTEFGKSIAETAENVLKEADNIKHKTKAFKGLLTGRLLITSASTGKYVIPYFLSGFLKQHPGIDLQLDVTNREQLIKQLKNNQTDFALVSVVPGELKLQKEILLENKLFLVGKTGKQEKDLPLIFREKGSATRQIMDHYYKSKKRRKVLELTSNEAVKQAVIAGLGYSVLPLISIKNELQAGEVQIISAPGLPIINTWQLIWLREKKLSPLAAAYLDYLRNSKHEIIKENFKWYLGFKM